MARIQHPDPQEHPNNDRPLTEEELVELIMAQARQLADFARDPRDGEDEITFKSFERALKPKVFAIARTAVVLFLTCAEARVRARIPTWLLSSGRWFQKTKARARDLTTWFGKVRYRRTYMLERGVEKGEGHGFYPLDLTLGLTSDRFSLDILAVVVRLATTLSFATAKTTAELFLPDVPATQVIEKATLGFGRYTNPWFEHAPAPEGDGDVLVMLFDGKGIAQITDNELKKRRRPWKDRERASSPRHRGRSKRGHQAPKKRRKKGDKSKNAKMATVVVMYTLRTVGNELHGPINPWVYASFAPKKHAFAVAWREARKRGFDPDGDDVIQIVTDGDEDLARYAKLFFPGAIHTLDVIHVVEKLWEAGRCLFVEGSDELTAWVEDQKDRLYGSRAKEVIKELRSKRRRLCRSQKNKKRRERLKEIIDYMAKRVEMMDYAEWVDRDLEIGSGAVEGAVKYIIGKRCDQGGMRWLAERSEAVVQLRCIEVNGDWERFIEFVHDKVRQQQLAEASPVRIQQNDPEALPDMLEPPGWETAA
jgi:hypothetical protein